jgi:hypothetical protein
MELTVKAPFWLGLSGLSTGLMIMFITDALGDFGVMKEIFILMYATVALLAILQSIGVFYKSGVEEVSESELWAEKHRRIRRNNARYRRMEKF